MNKKIGIIAQDIELERDIIALFSRDVEKGDIIIETLQPHNIANQGVGLEAQGVKAIIARSGVFKVISEVVKIPVISLKVTAVDILHAIKEASMYAKDIVLILWEETYFDYEEWKGILNREITLERFKAPEGIEEKVKKYIDNKRTTVIIGEGIACGYARKYGLDTVFINASKESIFETINYVKELVADLYDEKFKSEILKTILDGVHDAVVAVDSDGRVILYNKRAQDVLKKESDQIMAHGVLDVLPELDFMMEVLKNKRDQYREIKFLEDLVITANTSLLKVEGQIHGVLCSFQDITKLQKLEKKIRYELNKKGLVARYNFENMLVCDPIMEDAIDRAKKIANTDCTVIIYGESGTGKEVIAQSIHNNSKRNHSPFVAINCAAISENLLESELFGYEEGAFTGARKGGKPGLFELAHGGTIFLDEINSISFNLQAKLLRVLEEKEVMRIGSDYIIPLDVRIIAAANEELKNKVEEGSFRRDLFYRLSILELKVPPLRDRKKDIVPLFHYFLNELSHTPGESLKINHPLEQKLINYQWPGNVRELRSIAQRYILFNEVNLDEKEIIQDFHRGDGPGGVEVDLKEINKYVEEKVIDMLLKQGKTKTEIAKILGISRTALWKKIKG